MSTIMLPLRDAPLVRDETRLKEGGGIEMSTTVLFHITRLHALSLFRFEYFVLNTHL